MNMPRRYGNVEMELGKCSGPETISIWKSLYRLNLLQERGPGP